MPPDHIPIRPVRDTSTVPTDIQVRGVQVEVIRYYVMVALQHVRRTPDTQYTVQAKGWGHPAQVIAPMFDYCPDNIYLPREFIY